MHVDCDLYNSTNDCFPDLYPHVVAKGVVALDDFNDGGRGEKIAILEEIKDKKEKIYVGPAPQTYFVKQEDSTKEGKVINDFGFDYSFDTLLNNEAYIQWLNETMQDNFEDKMNQFLIKNTI